MSRTIKLGGNTIPVPNHSKAYFDDDAAREMFTSGRLYDLCDVLESANTWIQMHYDLVYKKAGERICLGQPNEEERAAHPDLHREYDAYEKLLSLAHAIAAVAIADEIQVSDQNTYISINHRGGSVGTRLSDLDTANLERAITEFSTIFTGKIDLGASIPPSPVELIPTIAPMDELQEHYAQQRKWPDLSLVHLLKIAEQKYPLDPSIGLRPNIAPPQGDSPRLLPEDHRGSTAQGIAAGTAKRPGFGPPPRGENS